LADYIWGTGRRKESIARVRVKPGKGKISVNGKAVEEYFHGREIYVQKVLASLKVTDTFGKLDVTVNVFGGGLTGQSGAVALGIARALVKMDEANKKALRKNGLLTRDPRMVERKKYGFRKARRSKQYSKR